MEFLVLFLFPHFLCAEGTWFQTGDRQSGKKWIQLTVTVNSSAISAPSAVNALNNVRKDSTQKERKKMKKHRMGGDDGFECCCFLK